MREGEPNYEKEKSPEKAVSDAISVIENKDAADSIINSKWANKGKEFAYKSITITGVSLGIATAIALKTLWGVLKFAKKAIEKKGNVGFKEGYEIGGEMFSFDGKKEKK